MAHGVCEALGESNSVVKMIGKPPQRQQPNTRKTVGVMGCRRIFSPFFKIRVLESYRNDVDCKGNQRATARKFNLHRRQIQKWLQAEDALRKTCTENNSMNNNGGVINRNGVNVSMPLTPPLSSPSSSSPSPSAVMMHHDNHHHHNHQQNSGAPATSPSLNLGLARLHGDELAIQQQQSHTQQYQAPPPPPPPPPSHSAQVAAAQALAVAATTQASYRFHGAASALQPVAATGYPHFKDKLPIQQQQQSHHYAPASAQHSMFYQPLAAATYQHTPAPSHHRYTIHYNYQQNPPSAPSHPTESEFHYQSPPRRFGTMLLNTKVKTERASPDSAVTPGPCESACSADLERQQPRVHYLKREHCAEERENVDYQRRTSSISSTVTSGSPPPSHQDHLESLPPSPRDSAEESAASSPEMSCEKRSGAAYVARKRKSYSLKFKINVLDAFYKDDEIVRNQRATARKFNIDRRQVQKWLDQECKLRGVICDSNNRQRLGPVHESNSSSSCSEETTTTTITIPVDLRTPTTTDLGQISPQSSSSFYNYHESSPSRVYVDSSLTPPYSTPGCSFSGCCSQETRIANPQSYCCYSPGEVESGVSSKQSSNCTESSLNSDSSKACLEDVPSGSEDEPVQDMPLCLVKPKKPSTTPVAPTSNKDAILFKPYLDNPVSKPIKDESAVASSPSNNNNCQDTRDLNERNVGLQQPWNDQPQYFEGPHVRSAFVRYPSAVHYS